MTVLKPLSVWITTNWKILKEMGIPDHLTCLLRNLYFSGGQEATEPDMEQQTGSKLGKEYIKAVYCHSVYLTYVQSTSCEMADWMNHKPEACGTNPPKRPQAGMLMLSGGDLGRGRLGSSFCGKDGSIPRQPGTDTCGPSRYSGPERSGPCMAVAVLGRAGHWRSSPRSTAHLPRPPGGACADLEEGKEGKPDHRNHGQP